ncbi:MAG: T9SS type A sorting domain-containing protein [Ignavibacteria bacterium]|nr:T9SS type A sorting domain-containing protein [Ignavibacteria bacterium]
MESGRISSRVNVTVFDLSGKEIVKLINDVKTAGYYTIDFNASNLSSGIYFYRISAGNFTATKKMTLIK